MFRMAGEMFSAEGRAQLDIDHESWKGSSLGNPVATQAMKEMGTRMD